MAYASSTEPAPPEPILGRASRARGAGRLAALCAAVGFWAWQVIEVVWGPFLFD